MAASAIGLAFSVPTDISRVAAVASWGRYERKASEVHETEQGRRGSRGTGAFRGPVEIPLEVEGSDYLVPDPDQEGVTVHSPCGIAGAAVRRATAGNGQRPVGGESPDVARLYQVGLTVTALDGNAAVFLGHNDPEVSTCRRRRMMSGYISRCCTGTSGSTRAGGSAPSTRSCERGDAGLKLPRRASRQPSCPWWRRRRARARAGHGAAGSHELGGDDPVRALRPLSCGSPSVARVAGRTSENPTRRWRGTLLPVTGAGPGAGSRRPARACGRTAADERDRTGGLPVREPGDGQAARAQRGSAGTAGDSVIRSSRLAA